MGSTDGFVIIWIFGSAALFLLGVVWGTLLLIKDHPIWAIILSLPAFIPLLPVGSLYAIYYLLKGEDNKPGLLILIGMSCLIIPVSFSTIIQNTHSTPDPTEIPSVTRKYLTDQIEAKIAHIEVAPTPTPSYSCPDLASVNLYIGANAIVSWYEVNLRSSSVVPDKANSNIVIQLSKGNRMTVIGGPECSHNGTWWEVKTDSGDTGWIRELLPDKRLLKIE